MLAKTFLYKVVMSINRIWQLYKLISANRKLSEKRHPMFERNMAMKIFTYVFICFWAIYLMFFGVVFYFAFAGASIEAYDMINGGAIFFLAVDFLLRFGLQETPAQEIKPYKLLPIPEKYLLNFFLLRTGLSGFNLFWFFFFVPYGMLSVPFYHGFAGLVGFLFGWWLLFVLNSYWYLLWRSFINKNILYASIPLAIYAALIYFGIFYNEECQWLFEFTMHSGQWFIGLDVIAFVLILLMISVLFLINGKIQRSMVYREIAKVDIQAKVKSSELKFLNSLGTVGQYMKLEIKSTIRNMVVRKQFIIGASYTFLLCALFAFTDVYDGMPFMKAFICVYCFACLGVMTLTSIMCAEGNYIDGLMSRRESVLSLLKAKYYFNCAVTLLPAIIIVMPIIEGKISVLEAVACLFFTTGVIFPFLFQLAVYNNTTLHLNEKLTKSGRSTKLQTIISMVALFFPMLLMYVLIVAFSVNVASVVMLGVGLTGTLLHPVWLRNIYMRFMKRRYTNMMGFRDTI